MEAMELFDEREEQELEEKKQPLSSSDSEEIDCYCHNRSGRIQNNQIQEKQQQQRLPDSLRLRRTKENQAFIQE